MFNVVISWILQSCWPWIQKYWPWLLGALIALLVGLKVHDNAVAREKVLQAAVKTELVVTTAQQTEVKEVAKVVEAAQEERERTDERIEQTVAEQKEEIKKEITIRVKQSNEKKPEELAVDFAKTFGAAYVKTN